MPSNGLVVSTRANERGSSFCEPSRGDPGGFAATNKCGVKEPSSTADAVHANGFVVSMCASNGLPNAHERTSAEHMLGDNTEGTHQPANRETDVHLPLPPKALSASNSQGPFNSAISERWIQLRGDSYLRENDKPTAIDSGAAIIQRKGD